MLYSLKRRFSALWQGSGNLQPYIDVASGVLKQHLNKTQQAFQLLVTQEEITEKHRTSQLLSISPSFSQYRTGSSSQSAALRTEIYPTTGLECDSTA